MMSPTQLERERAWRLALAGWVLAAARVRINSGCWRDAGRLLAESAANVRRVRQLRQEVDPR
jgi:hypothetical protein